MAANRLLPAVLKSRLVSLCCQLSSAPSVDHFAEALEESRLLDSLLHKGLTGPGDPDSQLFGLYTFSPLAKAVHSGLEMLQQSPGATPSSVKCIGLLCYNLGMVARGWRERLSTEAMKQDGMQMAQQVMKSGKYVI